MTQPRQSPSKSILFKYCRHLSRIYFDPGWIQIVVKSRFESLTAWWSGGVLQAPPMGSGAEPQPPTILVHSWLCYINHYFLSICWLLKNRKFQIIIHEIAWVKNVLLISVGSGAKPKSHTILTHICLASFMKDTRIRLKFQKKYGICGLITDVWLSQPNTASWLTVERNDVSSPSGVLGRAPAKNCMGTLDYSQLRYLLWYATFSDWKLEKN